MNSPLYDETKETRTKSATGGEKGVKKERFDLIPVEALQEVARVYGFGAQKYAAHNWRKGYEWSKSYAAMMRHANQFWQGEDVDEETGCSHLASVIFHAMALIVFIDEQPQYDDRCTPELTQVQKDNLDAFQREALRGLDIHLDRNRVAVKNCLDDGSP